MAVFAQRAILSVTSYRPEAARRYAPRPVDGSSTRGGSTSDRGRVRSPHISGGRPAAGSQRAYSLGWDRQTDGRIAVLRNAPHYDGGITIAVIFITWTLSVINWPK